MKLPCPSSFLDFGLRFWFGVFFSLSSGDISAIVSSTIIIIINITLFLTQAQHQKQNEKDSQENELR